MGRAGGKCWVRGSPAGEATEEVLVDGLGVFSELGAC